MGKLEKCQVRLGDARETQDPRSHLMEGQGLGQSSSLSSTTVTGASPTNVPASSSSGCHKADSPSSDIASLSAAVQQLNSQVSSLMEARAKHEVDIDYMAEHFLNMEFRLAKPWTLSADDKSPISHKEFALYKETTSRVLQTLDRNYSLLMQENKVRGLALEQLQAQCATLEHDKALQAQRNAELEQRCAQVNKQLCDQEDRLVLVEEDLGKVLDDLDAVKLQANSSLKRNAELEQRCADLEKELEGSRVEPVLTQVQQPVICVEAVQELSEVTKTPAV